jgi:AsmA protein
VKAIRYVLYAAGGLLGLAVIAVIAAVLVVDGAFVKSRLERAMKEKGRTLVIQGDPKLRLYPVTGISLGKLTLSEPGSDKLFVSLDSAEVAVQTMPLLSGAAAIETFNVTGLKVNVVRRKDGSLNFSDLAGEKSEGARERDSGGGPPKLTIAGMNVERAQLNYRDEASGQEVSVSDINVKAGKLDGDTPGPVSVSARATGRRPDMDLRAQAGGAMRFKLGQQEFAFDNFAAQVKGRLDRDTLAAELAAPKLEVTPARATGSAVTGSVQVRGPQRNVEAKLRIAAVEGSAAALSIPSLALDLDASVAGRTVKAKLEAALKADLVRRALNASLSGKLDESSIRASLDAKRLDPVNASFDLNVDRMNVDRYLPPKQAAKGDDRVDLSALKGPTVTGKAEFGALTVNKVRLSNVKAQVKLAGGKLEVSPHSANLYGGTLAGELTADASGNRVTARETLQNVQLSPLLKDAMSEDRLEGRGNVNLDVATAGPSVPAMKRALGGTARVELRDGAWKGVNLTETFTDVRSALGSRSARTADRSKRTDFSEITASFNIRNGVARNDDLQGKAPTLRLTGAGNIDIGNSLLDYLAKVAFVATSKGQGGRDLTNLAGVTLPIKVTGSFDNPNVAADYTDLIAKSGAGVSGTLGKAGGAVGEAGTSLGSRIKGLFGR